MKVGISATLKLWLLLLLLLLHHRGPLSPKRELSRPVSSGITRLCVGFGPREEEPVTHIHGSTGMFKNLSPLGLKPGLCEKLVRPYSQTRARPRWQRLVRLPSPSAQPTDSTLLSRRCYTRKRTTAHA